ncbi:hypothetical protein B0H15DRAFT_957404 [Mycena belliarum]|uniref:Uncharacterized protein n=1 Tax=Mycena belliarum TaxID=1033014 RepID=A0AAD6XGP8_9AGAR|nr:hypothetical protein B0H15DRAFT_957404 [Mycena belliae]
MLFAQAYDLDPPLLRTISPRRFGTGGVGRALRAHLAPTSPRTLAPPRPISASNTPRDPPPPALSESKLSSASNSLERCTAINVRCHGMRTLLQFTVAPPSSIILRDLLATDF